MADQRQNNRTQTSTQIRNMYSEGNSYLNIKFYNTDLSFKFSPYTGKDQNGRNQYDLDHSQTTTVNFEGAYALYKVAKDIIDGKVNETSITIPCNGASLLLERKPGNNGLLETFFTITKNNVTIPFKFQTLQQKVKENGNIMTVTIESGLGVFVKTIDGYLTGINSDRHLDKLTDDFVKIQGNNNQGNNRNNRNFNNNRNYNNNRSNWNQTPAQGFGNYSVQK